jgi:hypothetical protein
MFRICIFKNPGPSHYLLFQPYFYNFCLILRWLCGFINLVMLVGHISANTDHQEHAHELTIYLCFFLFC